MARHPMCVSFQPNATAVDATELKTASLTDSTGNDASNDQLTPPLHHNTPHIPKKSNNDPKAFLSLTASADPLYANNS